MGLDTPRFVAEYFKDIESVLAAGHALAPRQHAGDKGEDRESFLVTILNNHLPIIARAHRGGTVIDSLENRSKQTDIVVYSSWSPLLGQPQKPFFLAEGVFAAIEVKSTLTVRALRDAQEACTRLKRLLKFISIPPDDDTTIRFSPTAKTIAVGLFAYASRLRFPTVRNVLMDLHKGGVKNTEMLDFVSINQEGSFRRQRTEGLAASARSPGPQVPIEEIRKSCDYTSSPYAFAGMLEAILDHASYIGPFDYQIAPYLHHWTRGDWSTWK